MTRNPRTLPAGTTARGHRRRPIRIEVDPAVSGGFLLGRFDVLIRGAVVSASAVEEIDLLMGGAPVSTARYGDPDRRAGKYGFHFNLPRLRAMAGGYYNLSIRARTVDGDVHEEAYELAVAPDDPAPVSLLSGAVRRPKAGPGPMPPVIVYVEQADIDADGTVVVKGWAVSTAAPATVQVYVGDSQIAAAAPGEERDDVAKAYPDYPNAALAGFSLSVRVDDPQRQARAVRVETLGPRGIAHAVAVPLERLSSRGPAPAAAAPGPVIPTAEPVARHPIHMFCDSVTLAEDGFLTLSGWATCADDISTVLIYLDGILVGEAERGRERPDVARHYGAIPSSARAGFEFRRRMADTVGTEHTVRLLVRSGAGEEREETLAISSITPVATVAPSGPAFDSTEPEEFRFQLDSPRVVDGAAVAIVTRRLTVEGWVLARSGVAGVDVVLNGQRLGEVHYGLVRQDVGMAFPDWNNANRGGFVFHCPPRSLRNGVHDLRMEVRAKNGNVLTQSFRIEVQKAEDEDNIALIRRRVSRVESDMLDAILADLTGTGMPLRFALFLRQSGAVDPDALSATLNALRLQCFRDWRLTILADDPANRAPVAAVLDTFGEAFAAMATIVAPDDEAWREPLGPDGGLVGFLCPGDELGADALIEFALARRLRPAADFLYADETRLSVVTQEREPFFKPDFSPDLLLSTNYIGRPWVADASVINRLLVAPADLASTGEYDLVLRATEAAGNVHHIPKILCARGPAALDSDETGMEALTRAVKRRGIVADVLPTPVAGTWRVRRALTSTPKVSIVIPTCAAHGYIETCIETLRATTRYPNFEIIVIDNIPVSQMAWKIWLRKHADKIVDMPLAFNWSRFNNTAVDAADGEFVLFLNDDTEFDQPDWLDALMEHAQRAAVGVVGARLLYPDRRVQHAGMFLARNGIGRHAFRFEKEHDPGYFGLSLTQRNTIAVTGACMLVRRSVFDALGRFDEAHEIVNNDLDFCLRAHQAGLLTVYTPYATVIHHELASREGLEDVYDLGHFNSQWRTRFAAGDPYFNPNLSRNADDYRLDDEPVEVVHPGYPLFRTDDIQRILVVKLDHIGDFVTALPAIRYLRRIFPHAEISVLAGPASHAFASMEPAIDEFIEFSFFHSRSQLGERGLTPDDFAGLAERLKPRRFDLAVDLRKHTSTRDVLRYTGARFLAGFNYLGQYPFLDISLEWDGDRGLQRKHVHVIDDLMILATAIGRATGADRAPIQGNFEPLPVDEFPEQIQKIFDKPVVAVHPGAGNITKQWPVEHFSALIDLLIERNGVNVLLIGGPDEVGIADTLRESVLHKGAVASMAGQTSLVMLPRVLAACVLYIGNDSGPKHIAAAMGMPTIGIHSGVVDAAEWGPVGPRAVAVRRNMTCSPCYLADAADCPRALACLRGLDATHVHNLAEVLLGRTTARSRPLGRPDAGQQAQEAP